MQTGSSYALYALLANVYLAAIKFRVSIKTKITQSKMTICFCHFRVFSNKYAEKLGCSI